MNSQPTLVSKIVATIHQAHLHFSMIARWIAPPVLRITLALPFLRSGFTRWDGFLSLSPGTLFLFEEQFRLHIFGGEYALPVPDQLALLTAIAEIVLPILLIVGLATRFAALGLLVMTGVIQLVFPDGWANFHLYWAALALGVIAVGPGAISVDCGVRRMVNDFRPSGSTW
ncbi:DoxX family protein [Rhizobium leguminosarum]|nr:DoxX family protein [Rhizobium leguminosarum]MBY5905072.1 DoxX family protein [Rhizobium leguminosarum]MBY5912163.1 DoxX family protein [Rhizobium leguminosarum]MBY5919418.1 DoxX family protein [Rhizobium leguminosarum]TBZ61187.1 DoxX family protein [Rhizobium leguminosarum bv. viciae]